MSLVIYHPNLALNLIKYGIEIPLKDNRSELVFNSLSDMFKIKPLDEAELKSFSKEDLKLAHSCDFVEKLFSNECEKEMIHAFELKDEKGHWNRYNPGLGENLNGLFFEILEQGYGTYYSCLQALKNQFCFYLGGGMHHAMKDEGRGFCLINDIVISIRKLQKEKRVQKALVIDLDAHKGDGTAEITFKDSSILTLSVHMKNSWPMDTGYTKSLVPSDIDIEVAEGEEENYLSKLQEGLSQVSYEEIDFVVVVDGADPYEKDELPSTSHLNLSLDQLLARDMLVFNLLRQKKIPQCWLMAGGYGGESHRVYTQFLVKALDLMGKDSL